jgi:cytochrome c oxidase assembly protein subunit 15
LNKSIDFITGNPIKIPMTHTITSLIRRDRKAIIVWLAVCVLLVAAMVLIGGYTRLSGSGLSITEWKPLHGAVPPLTDGQWQDEFAGYQASPQYQKINKGMTLDEFKTIFWPEFIHRLLGRLIGGVLLLPLIIFALRRSISRRLGWRMAGIFVLGGVQGVIGWLMVKSGLVDDPNVSQIRLALHLSLALLILALLLWTLLDILTTPSPLEGEGRGGGIASIDSIAKTPPHPNPPPQGGREYCVWVAALCAQILLGALMAGLHAGLIYNTWPDMNGQFLPVHDVFFGESWYANRALVQFLHRTLAGFVALGFVFWWYLHRRYVKQAGMGAVCACIAAIIAVQFTLGVLTLLHQAPLDLALAHQMTALLLFTASVYMLHRLRHGIRI